MAMPRMTLHRLRLASRLESRTAPRVSPASRPNWGPREESWPETGAEGTTDITKKVLGVRRETQNPTGGGSYEEEFWKKIFPSAGVAGRGVRIGGGEMVTLMTLGFLSRGVGRRRTLFFAPSLYTFLLWNRNHQRRAIKMYRRPRRRKSEDALHLWGFNYSSCYCC